MSIKKRRILISGWFSFDLLNNTAGDLLAKQSAIMWATQAGFTCEVAVAKPLAPNEVATDTVDPNRYDSVVFVCGPLIALYIVPFIQKFAGIKRIALNVSIMATTDLSHEFDVIIPRDSPETTHPDISLVSHSTPVPVIGLIYAGQQTEYPNQQHDAVEAMVAAVVKKVGAAIIRIDTRLPHNEYSLSSIAQIESVIRHVDAIITTRLHGAVLSLRNGIPAIAIDSVPGGAKVLKQMQVLDWPLAYAVDTLDEEQLERAIGTALTKQSKELAVTKIEHALTELQKVETLFIDALTE